MAYRHMAYYYDQLMKDAPYDKWINFTTSVFENYQQPIKLVADLGCGTGEITTRLAKQNYHMYGVDYSSDMLTCADQKAQHKQVQVEWLKQDLRALTGLEGLDAVISYCDVINYITSEADLNNVFQRIYHSLSPEGIFIFDVHSLNYVNNFLTNNTFAHVTDDFSYIWFCVEGEANGEIYHELTFYAQADQDKFIRFDESHHQRTYPPLFYKQLLSHIGFESIHVHTDFSLNEQHLNEDADRIFFVAEKGSRS